MGETGDQPSRVEAGWYEHLTGEMPEGYSMPKKEFLFMKLTQGAFSLLPGAPRCLECALPLGGLGSKAVRPLGLRAASFSPRICNMCENAVRKHEGGAEVDLALLFADVRGSTALAERTDTFEFQRLIRRFYETASKVVIEHNGLVNRLMGDQVIGIFVPRFAGADYTGVAIEAGRSLLTATGHEEEAGPWVPVGAGVHTGRAFVGAVGAPDGVNEIAVLGNTANLTARLASAAAAGELYVSDEAALKAGLDLAQLPTREMALKGIERPVRVGIIRNF